MSYKAGKRFKLFGPDGTYFVDWEFVEEIFDHSPWALVQPVSHFPENLACMEGCRINIPVACNAFRQAMHEPYIIGISSCIPFLPKYSRSTSQSFFSAWWRPRSVNRHRAAIAIMRSCLFSAGCGFHARKPLTAGWWTRLAPLRRCHLSQDCLLRPSDSNLPYLSKWAFLPNLNFRRCRKMLSE